MTPFSVEFKHPAGDDDKTGSRMLSSRFWSGGFMCGILGVSSPSGAEILAKPTFLHMRDRMLSRGPDAAGYYVHENLQLGHRRLAIRDPQQGQQPWFSPSGRFVLIYNGEIYNDQELRAELKQHRFEFKTRCDTETLIAGYELWGKNVFRKINGMFACLVFDHQTKELIIARDPVGIKPLFYAHKHGSFITASSIKAILAHPDITSNYDWISISHYLSTFRLTLGERTLYQDIKQLTPGNLLVYKDGQLQQESYTDHKYPGLEHPQPNITLEDAKEQVANALSRAVSSQLQGDVDVGLFLSGGLDSSLIAHYQHQSSNKQIHSFFIQGDANSPSLSKLIDHGSGSYYRIDQAHHQPDVLATSHDSSEPLADQQIAHLCSQQYGFTHHDLSLGRQDYWQLWKYIIAETSLPLATPSDPLIYLMSLHARQHVGVVLGGEGADEFFLGYDTIQPKGHDYDLLNLLLKLDPQGHDDLTKSVIKQFQDQYGSQAQHSLVSFYFQIASTISPQLKTLLLTPEFLKSISNDQHILEHYESIFVDQSGISGISLLLQQLNLESLLSRLDTTTMLAGLEARVPYTDPELIRIACDLPLKYKLNIPTKHPAVMIKELEQQGLIKSKVILRSIADKYYPHSWNHRPKGSFPTPVFHWITHSWWSEVQHLLLNSPLLHVLFKQEGLELISNAPTTLGPMIWGLINLALWDQVHTDTNLANQRFVARSLEVSSP